MKIAVLAFGSLVNNPYSQIHKAGLHVEKPLHANHSPELRIREDSPFTLAVGLELPVRLGRLSSEGKPERRITCVLYQGATPEPVFYAHSKFTNLNDAISDLRLREGISENYKDFIGYVNLTTGKSRSKSEEVAKKINNWALQKGYDGVVWTDLPPKGVVFMPNSTGREILPLLENDPVLLQNTKKYIEDLATPPNRLQNYILGM